MTAHPGPAHTGPGGPATRIPLVDVREGGPVALFGALRPNAAEIVRLGQLKYGARSIAVLDALSRRWARRLRTPYIDEIAAISAGMPAGIWYMNLCFEWGCTVGVMDDPGASGMRMLRTLDWPFDGLGRNLVVARQQGPAGAFLNLTWPGFVGVVQAMAPGRFTIALNQAPLMRRLSLPVKLDWLINRLKVMAGRRIPPAHLLRRVAETCRHYEEARELLATTPIALPAIFSIAGVERGEGAVIERLERRAFIHEAPAAAANHWISKVPRPANARGNDSYRRHRLMNGYCRSQVSGFDWLSFPVLNPDTRLAMTANARSGDLCVQGYEADGLATETFVLGREAVLASDRPTIPR